MNPDLFLGEVILESLQDPNCLESIEPYLIKTRVCAMPAEKIKTWHVQRYRLPRHRVLAIAQVIAAKFAPGEWYVHFFSEQQNEMVVIMRNRTFRLPKHRDVTWDEMIAYGESVGIGRRWTQSIPINLPD